MGKFLSDTIGVEGLGLQVGSDYHYSQGTGAIKIAQDILGEYIEGNILCIHGDIFDNPQGIDNSKEVSEVISLISGQVKQLIFVPGNHDLRGRKNPFESFNLPSNVITPLGQFSPQEITIEGVKFAIANVLYDGKFIETQDPRYSQSQIEAFYRKELPDGVSLDGNFKEYEQMTQAVRKSIQSFLPHVLITHVTAHPSLVTFIGEIETSTPGINILKDEEYIQKQLVKRGVTRDEFIAYWNYKSFVMGSNVFHGVTPREGMIAIYGHNHRGNTSSEILVNGRKVVLMSGPQPVIAK